MSESDEIEASVSVVRVVASCSALRVLEADDADGNSASVGRVICESVYAVPYIVSSDQIESMRRTVSRPSEKVPTNLVRVIGHTPIVAVDLCDGDGD